MTNFDALLPAIREALGDAATKAEVYDLEQAMQDDLAEVLRTSVIGGNLALSELMTDHFVRALHHRLRRDARLPGVGGVIGTFMFGAILMFLFLATGSIP